MRQLPEPCTRGSSAPSLPVSPTRMTFLVGLMGNREWGTPAARRRRPPQRTINRTEKCGPRTARDRSAGALRSPSGFASQGKSDWFLLGHTAERTLTGGTSELFASLSKSFRRRYLSYQDNLLKLPIRKIEVAVKLFRHRTKDTVFPVDM